ncbi:MAG: hypothetical protein CMA88_03215 [Euryarchaeota archaeon]|mgnify:CR=1 FL=1|nr:hypothetical protein [Euryarchaeota archaeon]|tara:strand:- start:975 stop:1502 length:528 start_codon:yes stop_codon:yes gene_type:complete
MPEEDSEWKDVLLTPSSTLSSGAILVGSWMLLLTIINITIGAYSPDNKVLWIGFLTGGEAYSSSLDIVLDDAVFAILSLSIIGAGVVGMDSAREDGISGWISDLPKDRMVTSVFSTEEGVARTIASWMILSGSLYYLIWSSSNTTWVDPGVYSVMIALISLGVGIHWIKDSESSD